MLGVEDMATSTNNRNNNKYEWCIFIYTGYGGLRFHYKDVHKERETNLDKKRFVLFAYSSTNIVICCCYLMATSMDYVGE